MRLAQARSQSRADRGVHEGTATALPFTASIALVEASEVSGRRRATDALEPAGDPIDDQPAIVL
jgi:hypothetical protein